MTTLKKVDIVITGCGFWTASHANRPVPATGSLLIEYRGRETGKIDLIWKHDEGQLDKEAFKLTIGLEDLREAVRLVALAEEAEQPKP